MGKHVLPVESLSEAEDEEHPECFALSAGVLTLPLRDEALV